MPFQFVYYFNAFSFETKKHQASPHDGTDYDSINSIFRPRFFRFVLNHSVMDCYFFLAFAKFFL